MIKSQAIRYRDFSSKWYKRWSRVLRQENGLYDRKIHNKAWQNAAILQALHERGYLKASNKALGFGVGTERVPSALASLDLLVTATDQDYKKGKKQGWDHIGQLTKTRDDLNQYGIADGEKFDKNVEFMNCDMNNIGPEFNNNYDIIWSNCALGHLGSIELGLKFIEQSLECLKPGGIAVHTTELNVVSDDDTLDMSDTVVFRPKDIIALFYRLRLRGYRCTPLVLDFGKDPEDFNFSAEPHDDDPLLKLNVSGHLLSQVILIIQKPKHASVLPRRLAAGLAIRFEERINKRLKASYLEANTALANYLNQQTPAAPHAIQIDNKIARISLKPNEESSVILSFKNLSKNNYYDIHQIMAEGHPLAIATTNPINRSSKMATSDWPSKSRPINHFIPAKRASMLEGVAPGRKFSADLTLKAPVSPGKYAESFCFVVEGVGIVPKSEFKIEIQVTA